MRKLIALIALFLLCILPATHVNAEQSHFDSLVIPDGLFEKQSFDQQRNLLLNELISQLHLYEQYLGKSRVVPGVRVILSGNDMTNFNPNKPFINGNTIFLVQTSDDYSNIGKFNTIFEQLVFINFPDADYESAEIIASFLKYKHLGVNVPKIAGLYRYCFPNQYLYDDRIKSEFTKPFSQTVKMLAIAKINELDLESDPKLKTLMADCLNEGIFAACNKHYVEFPAFVRSAQIGLPNLKIKNMLEETEGKRKALLSGMHFHPNKTDIQLRLDSMKDLDAALIFISQGDDVKSGLMLVKVETYLENIASVEKTWWIALAAMILSILACFLYIHNRLLLANTVDIGSVAAESKTKLQAQQKSQQEAQTNQPQQIKINQEPIKPDPKKPVVQESIPAISTDSQVIESIQESIGTTQPVVAKQKESTTRSKSSPEESNQPKTRKKKVEAAIEKIEKIKSQNSTQAKNPSKKTSSTSKNDKKSPSKRKSSK